MEIIDPKKKEIYEYKDVKSLQRKRRKETGREIRKNKGRCFLW